MDRKLVYSVAEVADMLDIAIGTAYECVHRGELPSVKLGRRIVIPRKALMELLEVAIDIIDDGSEPARSSDSLSVHHRLKLRHR